ncbi:NAD-dependent epimerase/dehydratase family protein [Methylomicrobium sp. Wu6]|uniref:NAD-dependent epimerase/dehydratase family protein n=1 Tax=Methylomicrobium sp. Wu6 TaxID=3107928 RepID=UPI002DD6335A|nr:NAD-dependent epimerase/dehydratase family protein [Methylomicrobium sp. Wu6]MEC4750107.1 NAD-dependent epimerase/dehydratase family protein [Methylomicrobium sp. Wu6]
MKKILVTGATGQIGSELTLVLRDQYGAENVIAAAYNRRSSTELPESGPFYGIDVRDTDSIEQIVADHRCDTIFHLAALLSAVAEDRPQEAWDINMNGLINVLEASRKHRCSVFFPSSIGAFGPGTPANDTPQDTMQRPTTIYGITKVSGELLCDYYYRRFGVDTRGLRYPGLISSKVLPGGGSTDYAVEIFYAALTARHYDCFLSAETQLDMMYMPDAIDAAIRLMNADNNTLRHRNAFNVTAMSFTPAKLAAEIQKHIPDFTIAYAIDPVRQAIASSWPRHMDDSAARAEWGWQPRFDLAAMVRDMLEKIAVKIQNG